MIRKCRDLLVNRLLFKKIISKKMETKDLDLQAIAFFYGSNIPVEYFPPNTRLVIEAEAVTQLSDFSKKGILPFAYVSMGEAESWRAATQALPDEWFFGTNDAWQSRIADFTHPDWRRFIIEDRIDKLWKLGFKGIFLDTLDSYKLKIKEPALLLQQKNALISLIKTIHKRFPKLKILVNRGFDLMPDIHPIVTGVVAESLLQSWDPISKCYTKVGENDHLWLLNQLRQIKSRYHLPVTVIDYVDPEQKDLARQTARRIESLGFGAWISTPSLDSLNLGVAA